MNQADQRRTTTTSPCGSTITRHQPGSQCQLRPLAGNSIMVTGVI